MAMVTRLVAGLINFFLVLGEIFLGLRIILRFFAANPFNGFVHWIYSSSDVLMQPFRGIFPSTVIGNNHVVDFSAMFAMVVYGLLVLAFAALAAWLNPTRYTTAPVVKRKVV
jgi:uncharacterized protein YggT (Ycf19 family)